MDFTAQDVDTAGPIVNDTMTMIETYLSFKGITDELIIKQLKGYVMYAINRSYDAGYEDCDTQN